MRLRGAVGELFVVEHGRGRPILTLHGFGLDHTCFEPHLDALADDVRWLHLDLAGCGESERPGDWSAVSTSTWLDDIEHVRRHLQLDRLVILGHSAGGFLALDYALAYPDCVEGLLLCSAAPALDAPVGVARLSAAEREAFSRFIAGTFVDDEELRGAWDTLLPRYFADPRPELIRDVYRRVRFSAAAWNRAAQVYLPHYGVTDRLGELGCPIVAITGVHDWVCPPSGALRIARSAPRARAAIFSGSGHFPFVEERDAFEAAVRSFLGELT